MAIQEAMTHLDTSVHHDIYIFIFSDSQAALRALDSHTTNSNPISECYISVNEMATHLRINLIWVPGHRNIKGNCIAVEQARQGKTADILRGKDTGGMPMATCKLHLRERLYTLSNNRWNSISTWHNSRLTWSNYNSKRTKTLLQCSREDISTLLNALTGHGLIGTHAHSLGLSSHDFCRSCKQIDEEESIEHLLCFCPANSLKRITLGSYTFPNLAAIHGVSIQKLLCFLRRTKYFAKHYKNANGSPQANGTEQGINWVVGPMLANLADP